MSARRYALRRWAGPAPRLDGRAFAPEAEPFCALDFARIDTYPWDESGYRPEARAYLARAEGGLLALLCAREAEVFVREARFGGSVCRDSCLEFFLNPCPSRGERYLNVEVSAGGCAHIGVGEGRHGRRVLEAMPEGIALSHSRHEGGWWAVSYVLPDALLRDCFGAGPEREMRGNFYTCEEIARPHYGCWSPVRAPQPDFHRPECFGHLLLED